MADAAVAEMQKLIVAYGESADRLGHLASAYGVQGATRQMHDAERAIESYRMSVNRAEKVVALYGPIPSYLDQLVAVRDQLARMYQIANRFDEAWEISAVNSLLAVRMTCEHGVTWERLDAIGCIQTRLALCLIAKDRIDEAAAAAAAAAEASARLMREFDLDDIKGNSNVLLVHVLLADCLSAPDHESQLELTLIKARSVGQHLIERGGAQISELGRAAQAEFRIALLLLSRDDLSEAAKAFAKALELAGKALHMPRKDGDETGRARAYVVAIKALIMHATISREQNLGFTLAALERASMMLKQVTLECGSLNQLQGVERTLPDFLEQVQRETTASRR